jgi:hypothetical protein
MLNLHAALSSWIKTVLKGQSREFELFVLFLLGLLLYFSCAPLFLRGLHIWDSVLIFAENLLKTNLVGGLYRSRTLFAIWVLFLAKYLSVKHVFNNHALPQSEKLRSLSRNDECLK